MSTDAKINVRELIKADIAPKTIALVKEQKEGITKLAKVMIDLDKAIDKSDARMVKLLAKALDADSALVANRLSRTGRLLERLEEAEADTDVDAELKVLEDITGKLSELETKLKANYEAVKEYQTKAEKALEDTKDVEGDAAEQWALYEAYLRKESERSKKRVPNIQKVLDSAKKAADARDEKALKQAIADGVALKNYDPGSKDLQDSFSGFCIDVQPEKLSPELQDQFKRDQQKFQKLLDDTVATNDQISKIQDQIEKVEVVPLDAKKVSALLKIPSQYDGKVKKALKLDRAAAGKALEAIMKEAKIPMPAKDILSKLEKGNLFYSPRFGLSRLDVKLPLHADCSNNPGRRWNVLRRLRPGQCAGGRTAQTRARSVDGAALPSFHAR